MLLGLWTLTQFTQSDQSQMNLFLQKKVFNSSMHEESHKAEVFLVFLLLLCALVSYPSDPMTIYWCFVMCDSVLSYHHLLS